MEDNADAVHAVLSDCASESFCRAFYGRLCRFGFAELYPDTIKKDFY
jgi:hypothetical protein